MGTHALTIIKEEFEERFNDPHKSGCDQYATYTRTELRRLQDRIVERIEKECIDQPEPKSRICIHCGAHTPLSEAQICSQGCGAGWSRAHPNNCPVCGDDAPGSPTGLCSYRCGETWYQLPWHPLPPDREAERECDFAAQRDHLDCPRGCKCQE